jgi:signal transduction histidine kinase
MASCYDNLSVLFDKQKKKAEALDYIKKSIVISQQMNDTPGMAGKMRWAAILCGDLKDTLTMNSYNDQVYNVAIRLKNKTLLRDFYGSKAAYYKKTNDYRSAYDNLKQYYNYRDSLNSEATATNIAELQTKYETEKKDNEITRLNTEQKIKQLQIEKQRATIAGNVLEAKQKENDIRLLSQQQQLRDAKISQQAEELEKQLLVAKNNQQELKLAEQEKLLSDKQLQNQKQFRNLAIMGIVLLLITAGVVFNRFQLKKKLEQQQALLQMRNNIARDLHDEIGSTLTSINILSQVSQNNLQKDRNKASSMLEKITEQSSQIQQGMSDIVWAIAPHNDKLENMVARMREYASHTLESRNITTVFEIDEKALSKNIGMEQRRDFFLIFKEAINNVAKYAGAQQVHIRLCAQNNALSLEITDDGAGFDTTQATTSNGLKNMRARAEALHGHIAIQSGSGKGTFVKLEIPAT